MARLDVGANGAISWQFRGLDDALRKASALMTGPEARRALGAALYQEMDGTIRGDVIENRVPVDQGTLSGSITTYDAEWSGNEVTVTLAAGGPAAPYALVQHERTDFQHPSKARRAKGETYGQGEAKYMSNALAAAEPGQPARVGRTFAAQIGLR